MISQIISSIDQDALTISAFLLAMLFLEGFVLLADKINRKRKQLR